MNTKMNTEPIQQVIDNLTEMNQELFLFSHISCITGLKERIYQLISRIRMDIAILSKVIEKDQGDDPGREMFSQILDKF